MNKSINSNNSNKFLKKNSNANSSISKRINDLNEKLTAAEKRWLKKYEDKMIDDYGITKNSPIYKEKIESYKKLLKLLTQKKLNKNFMLSNTNYEKLMKDSNLSSLLPHPDIDTVYMTKEMIDQLIKIKRFSNANKAAGDKYIPKVMIKSIQYLKSENKYRYVSIVLNDRNQIEVYYDLSDKPIYHSIDLKNISNKKEFLIVSNKEYYLIEHKNYLYYPQYSL